MYHLRLGMEVHGPSHGLSCLSFAMVPLLYHGAPPLPCLQNEGRDGNSSGAGVSPSPSGYPTALRRTIERDKKQRLQKLNRKKHLHSKSFWDNKRQWFILAVAVLHLSTECDVRALISFKTKTPLLVERDRCRGPTCCIFPVSLWCCHHYACWWGCKE